VFVKEVDVDACVEFAMQSQMGDCPCEYHFPGLCHVVQLFNKVLLGKGLFNQAALPHVMLGKW